MDPMTITAALKVLGKAFNIGLAVYKVRQSWGRNDDGLHADDVKTLADLFSNSSDLVGLLPSDGGKGTAHLFARHAALATSAFAAALDHHWASNKDMAPGFGKSGRLRQLFSSKSEKEREEDIQSRLKRALDRVGKTERLSTKKTLDLVALLMGESIASPWYQALWEAFTNRDLESDTPPQLLELQDDGAKLEFEHAYRLEYAAALASQAGVELGRAVLELQSTQPARLRDLLLRGMSTWDREHVFGNIETPGMPNMPLEDIYVEPDGFHEQTKRRAPLQTLIREFLTNDNIVIVRGDFGHGKSLTARRMACAWAKDYLTEPTTSSVDLTVPVFMKCGEDFDHHQPPLEKVVARALRRQANNLGLDVPIDSPMLVLPQPTQKVVYVVDGLDEVALTSTQVEEFFRNLQERTGSRHKAIVFSRKGVIPEREKLRGIPVIDVLPFRVDEDGLGGQVAEWLEKWNLLSDQTPITMEQLREKNLLDIVTTPIVLFMAAMTWDAQDKAGEPLTRAEIYERFFQQIATGKCRQDQEKHMPVFDASGKLLEKLVDEGQIDKPKKHVDESTARAEAMLWLMGRIAWEGQRRAQKDDDLTLTDVTNILRSELELGKDPHVEETIRVGVLLALQADRQGGNDRILFGHKSFREFLVARYWAGQLRRIVLANRRDPEDLEKNLLGARLLGKDDEIFDFLLQMLNGSSWDNDREDLIEWAQDCFNDERPEAGAKSWLEDRRPVLREAALAIGSSVKGAMGIKAKKTTTLRTMLAWFWLADMRLVVIAPGLISEGAALDEVNLQGANLRGANLRGASLERTVLHHADLESANLVEANLIFAKLMSARLCKANLQRARLFCAHLTYTNLDRAHLQDALLTYASLKSVKLHGANLQGAILKEVNSDKIGFDETTQWPDGVIIQDGKVIVPNSLDDEPESSEQE